MFDYTGLGTIAQLPDLVEDLEHMNVDLENLKKSAEKYIEVWERSYNIKNP